MPEPTPPKGVDSIESLISLLTYVSQLSSDLDSGHASPSPDHITRLRVLLNTAQNDLAAVRVKIVGADDGGQDGGGGQNNIIL